MANNQASKSVVIDYDAIANQESFRALVRKKECISLVNDCILLSGLHVAANSYFVHNNLTPEGIWGNYLGVGLRSRIIHYDLELMSLICCESK